MTLFFPILYFTSAITSPVQFVITPTLTITRPVEYQVIQRNEYDLADIKISGFFTGDLQAVEVRLGSKAAWQTIDDSPSDGIFSGTLSNQPAGQYTLEVRPSNNPSDITQIGFVGIGDIFVIAGESNASGRGDNLQAYSHATLKAGLFGNDYLWQNLTDPLDDDSAQVDAVSGEIVTVKGNTFILVATSFLADQNVPIAFVPCPKGGTTISDWQPGADHQDRTTLYGSMVYRANQVGGVKAVLLWLGINDALARTTQANFNNGLDTFANTAQSDLGVPTMIGQIHAGTGKTVINAAIVEAQGDNANVIAGPDLSDLTTSPDQYHFTTDAHLSTVASRWWTAMQSEWY